MRAVAGEATNSDSSIEEIRERFLADLLLKTSIDKLGKKFSTDKLLGTRLALMFFTIVVCLCPFCSNKFEMARLFRY